MDTERCPVTTDPHQRPPRGRADPRRLAVVGMILGVIAMVLAIISIILSFT